MFYNGSFPRRIFDIDSDECDEKISRIIQTCGLPKNMSKKQLEDSAEPAIGSYFVRDSTHFRFIHDALEETVSCHFYKFNPRVMFSDCDILFIRDRVRVHSDRKMIGNVDKNIVIILEDELNEDRLKPLYKRLCTELLSGRFSILLTSHLFKNRKFVHIFGTHFENSRRILGLTNTFMKMVSSEQIKNNQSSSVGKWINKHFISNKFRDNSDAINRVIEAIADRSTLMYWIVAFGCYEFFQYAWNKMSTIEHKKILGINYVLNPFVKPFFPLAVLGGSLNIVTQLISSGADVNCFSEFGKHLYV
ncbi:unnamed protein product [Mytilus edulis]|uniref:Uncharacterized protein n=1 Tax=Mytilus edulis TaxID=6550 RepID=A0A8S3VEJ3_MYTED|nr:unnamed protein product [Mytilus edulis]